MKNLVRIALLALSAICVSVVAHAGVVIQQEGGEVGGNKPKQKMTLSIESGKIRIESQTPDQKQNVMIFDGDRKVMWMITPDEGTYHELTEAQVKQMGNQMGDMMKQMEAQMAQMPPEQRKMVEEMMKKSMGGMGAAPPVVTVQEKGSGEKVGQYTTTHYQMTANGQVTQEIWAASPDQMHLDAADFKAFQAMAEFFKPLTRNIPKGAWSAPDMQQIKGLPVRTLDYENGKPAFEWTFVSVEQRKVDAAQFALPPNLKKVDMGGGMGGPAGRPGMGPGGMGGMPGMGR